MMPRHARRIMLIAASAGCSSLIMEGYLAFVKVLGEGLSKYSETRLISY